MESVKLQMIEQHKSLTAAFQKVQNDSRQALKNEDNLEKQCKILRFQVIERCFINQENLINTNLLHIT